MRLETPVPARVVLSPILPLLLLTPVSHGDESARLEPHDGWPQPRAPLACVVHGINPTDDGLTPLSEDLAARGYRVMRFSYDDDRRLDRSAAAFAERVDRALDVYPSVRRVAVVAHSMGGLVARRAFATAEALRGRERCFKLVTVASPFGGFTSANFSVLDLGLGPPVHRDLGSWSSFIDEPGTLGRRVRHVKVETDEEGRRVWRDGEPRDDDSVGLGDQRQETVDAQAWSRVTLPRGHTEVVRMEGGVSPELSAVLDRELGRRLARGRTSFRACHGWPAPGEAVALVLVPPGPERRRLVEAAVAEDYRALVPRVASGRSWQGTGTSGPARAVAAVLDAYPTSRRVLVVAPRADAVADGALRRRAEGAPRLTSLRTIDTGGREVEAVVRDVTGASERGSALSRPWTGPPETPGATGVVRDALGD